MTAKITVRSVLESALVRREYVFWGICAALVVLFRHPLEQLASLALTDDRYTPTLALPVICFAVVWLDGRRIFAATRRGGVNGVPLALAAALAAGIMAVLPNILPAWVLTAQVFALVLLVAGTFAACYGTAAVEAAAFPLAMLLLMVPIPGVILDRVVAGLQNASADISYHLFRLTSVPVLREGQIRFLLPGFSIEVAPECSGIRSSYSLLISGAAAAYLLLGSVWSRLVFTAAVIPIVILKNAMRIVGISLLAEYVDPSFLHGQLHRYSGLPFSLVALLFLAPLLLALMKAEHILPWDKAPRRIAPIRCRPLNLNRQ